MNKRYDQRSTLCPTCHYFWKAGMRDVLGGSKTFFPDGCRCYGYSFHDDYDPSEECDGYMTEEQFKTRQQQILLMKKRKR